MVEVKGRMYGTILVDVDEVINALCNEANVLRTMKENDGNQENAKLFLEASEVIKSYYREAYESREKNGVLDFIEVNGFSTGSSFCVRESDIVQALYRRFCVGYSDLMVKNNYDSIGVFNCYDISYHGSPVYKYTLVYEGKVACDVFKAICQLNKNCIEYDNYLEQKFESCQREKCHALVKKPIRND